MLEEQNDTQVEAEETSSEDNSDDYENTGKSEADAEAESENTEASGSETQDDGGAKKRAQSQIDRLKAKIKELEEGGEKGGESGKESRQEIDEKYVRLDLKTEGVTSKKEQDVVLDYIRERKLLGKDTEVSDALKSMVVKEELANIRKAASVSKPSTRTSTQERGDDLQYYANLMKKGRTSEVPLDKQREIRKKRLISW